MSLSQWPAVYSMIEKGGWESLLFGTWQKYRITHIQSTKQQHMQTYAVDVEAQVLVEHVKLSWSHWRLGRLTGRWRAARIRAEVTEKGR